MFIQKSGHISQSHLGPMGLNIILNKGKV